MNLLQIKLRNLTHRFTNKYTKRNMRRASNVSLERLKRYRRSTSRYDYTHFSEKVFNHKMANFIK